MGSGSSRGKKVAPACVTEVNVTKTGANVASTKQDRSPFKPLRNHSVWRKVPARAQPDCHSQGRDSDFSGEDLSIDGELERDLEVSEDIEKASVKRTCPKKSFIRSKTYGLCHFGQEDAGEEVSPPDPRLQESGGAEGPRVSHGGSKDVNKRDNSAAHLKRLTPACSTQTDVRAFIFVLVDMILVCIHCALIHLSYF